MNCVVHNKEIVDSVYKEVRSLLKAREPLSEEQKARWAKFCDNGGIEMLVEHEKVVNIERAKPARMAANVDELQARTDEVIFAHLRTIHRQHVTIVILIGMALIVSLAAI